MLLAGYPSAAPADPEGYLALVIAVFTRYPEKLVARAVQPGGIMTDCPRFLPTVGEITGWLDRHQERRRPLSLPPPPVDRAGRPSYEQLRDICARAGLTIGRK